MGLIRTFILFSNMFHSIQNKFYKFNNKIEKIEFNKLINSFCKLIVKFTTANIHTKFLIFNERNIIDTYSICIY